MRLLRRVEGGQNLPEHVHVRNATRGRAHPLRLMDRITHHFSDPRPKGHKKSHPGKEWRTFYKCGKARRLMVGRTRISSYNLVSVPLPPRPW